MEQAPSYEAKSSAIIQSNSLDGVVFSPVRILSQMILVHSIPSHFFSIHFNIVFLLRPSLPSRIFPSGIPVYARMRWAGHVARMGEERGVYRVLVGKPEGKRPLGRPRRRWVDNIRMDLHEVGCGHVDWIGLAQDRDRWRTLVSAVMNLRVP